MAENVLKTRIEGDIKDLEAKLNKADKLMQQYERNINNVQKAIAKNVKDSQSLERQLDQLNNAYSSGEISQEKYEKETNRLTKSFQKSQQETRDFHRELKRLETEYKRVSSASVKLNNSTKQLPKSVDNAAKSTEKLQKGTANATPTLTEFSRVIQDAPYGIQGVANNIQQLTTQFSYLQRKTGSAKSALQAVLSSFTGPAGIIFAVSAATSILVSYGDELLALVQPSNELAKATKDYYTEARVEIKTLEQLVKIARDENLSKEARQKAIDELNDKYGEYLGNLDLETVKYQQVTDSVNKLTKALITKAKIQGLEDLISEKTADSSEKLIQLDLKRQETIKGIQSELKNLAGSNFNLRNIIDTSDIDTIEGVNRQLANLQRAAERGGDFSATTKYLRSLVAEYKNVGDEIGEVNKEAERAIAPFLNLQSALKEQDFSIDFDKVDPLVIEPKVSKKGRKKAAKDWSAFYRQLFKDSQKMEEEDQAARLQKANEFANELSYIYEDQRDIDPFGGLKEEIEAAALELDQFEEIVKRLRKVLGEDFGGEGFNLEGIRAFEERLMRTTEVATIFGDAVASSMQVVGNKISEYLETGNEVVDAFVGSVINGLSQLAAAFIKQKILDSVATQAKVGAERAKSQANAVTIATNAAAALGPAGVAALPGLIAAQTALVQGAFGAIQLQSFNDGGFVSGGSFNGDSTLIRANAGELVLNNQQQRRLFSMINGNTPQATNNAIDVRVVGEISGNNIKLVQERFTQRQSRRN